MKDPIFTGAGVAVITPMYPDGRVNFKELGRLLDHQLAHGTDAVIICGTTGEASTLEDSEHLDCIEYAAQRVAGRVPVIAGTGSNNTQHAVMMSQEAAHRGVDGLLLVTPYYNKTSQEGLVRHFTTIVDAAGLPAILYNVPSRTGTNIAPETALRLSAHPLIRGLKEASGNIAQVASIAALCGDELPLYSGNDDQIVPMLALGAKGVISVLSNVAPQQAHDICQLWFDGKPRQSRELQLQLLPLIHALFCDVNPIPVKAAMELLGWQAGPCRLPLAPLAQKDLEAMRAQLAAAKLM